MDYKIVLLPQAIVDFEKSIEWYSIINPLLSSQFIADVEITISFVNKNPLLFQYAHNQYKSANTSQFPFKIIYRIDIATIIIVAILHHKRNPNILSSRIK